MKKFRNFKIFKFRRSRLAADKTRVRTRAKPRTKAIKEVRLSIKKELFLKETILPSQLLSLLHFKLSVDDKLLIPGNDAAEVGEGLKGFWLG